MPALKDGTAFPSTWTVSWVRGLRPMRARRCFTVKAPNPRSSSVAALGEEDLSDGLSRAVDRAANGKVNLPQMRSEVSKVTSGKTREQLVPDRGLRETGHFGTPAPGGGSARTLSRPMPG